MSLDGQEIRALFDSTEIVRIPRYGIVKGYHELPYVCIGESFKSGYSTTRVKGTIQVSPQFLIKPSHYNPSYEDMFGEENTDQELKGRMFGFLGFHDRPVECKSEHLELKHVNATKDRVLSETLDELERYEDITTGVIISPNAQYFPVSVEKFISTILEDEFSY